MTERYVLRIEERARLALGRDAGFRGEVRLGAHGLQARLVPLTWRSLRRAPSVGAPRDATISWGSLAGVEVDTRRGESRLRLRAGVRNGLSELPGSDEWTWSAGLAPGQDLEALEWVAEVELRVAELGRPSTT